MRRVIRRRIRREEPGLNLAADINVVIATGEGPVQERQRAEAAAGPEEGREPRPQDPDKEEQ